jgi:hypothetical protein
MSIPNQQKRKARWVPASGASPNTNTSGIDTSTPLDVKSLEIHYDHHQRAFWIKNDRAMWILVSTTDVRRKLKGMGFRASTLDHELLSQVDVLLSGIQESNDVDYAGSLAGYQTGTYMIGGKRVLVRDSPELLKPEPGDWPTLRQLIKNMLGKEQQDYLFGWLKVSTEALYTSRFRVGQALVLTGPKACGKSLLQHLITIMLGGRSAKSHRYMSGGTSFNLDLIGCEHLMIEDEQSSTDFRSRVKFGSRIKEICANLVQSAHGKNRTAISLPPFWRISISVNDETEHLLILPPIDESLEDKFIILKAEKHAMPMPSLTDAERDAFMAKLQSELPHFLHFLFDWEIHPDLQSQRYGITHFHHPEVMEAISELTPETRLLDMIDHELFSPVNGKVPASWTGSSNQMERRLAGPLSDVKRDVIAILTFPQACGTYLGRLRKEIPERVSFVHTDKGNIWTIKAPDS